MAWTIFCLKILVSAQVEIAAIVFPEREHESNLRPNPKDTSFEIAELRPEPSVAGELLEEIADDTNMLLT